jgi:hypothetical protein
VTNYEKVKAWRLANPEKVLEQARKYRARHPETNKRAKQKYRQKNLFFIRETDKLNKRYMRTINPEEHAKYHAAYTERQKAKQIAIAGRPKPETCEICNELNLRIVFDHCHAHGHFRGWICDRCNKVLGLVKDSSELLSKLREYLGERLPIITI